MNIVIHTDDRGAMRAGLLRLAAEVDPTRAVELAVAAFAGLEVLGVHLDHEPDDGRALPPPGTHRRALLTRIRAFIESHLGDPQLSPRAVAAAHHISVRYLHKLFEPEVHSVAGMIRYLRLEHCRHDLLDPAQAGRPVAGIAARWGFSSAAHFSRLFRDAYGLPPAEFRRVHSLRAVA